MREALNIDHGIERGDTNKLMEKNNDQDTWKLDSHLRWPAK